MLIYLIRNLVNAKVYIGKHHGNDLECRWLYHAWCAVNRKTKRNHFHSAIRKYGVKNFSVIQLAETKNARKLSQLERKFIKLYASNDQEFGYNCTDGGEGQVPNARTRKLMSENRKGKPIHPNFLAAAKKHVGKNNPFFGRKHTPEARKKMGRPGSKKSKVWRAQMSERVSGKGNPMYGRRGKKHPRYGVNHTPEARLAISKARKKSIREPGNYAKHMQLLDKAGIASAKKTIQTGMLAGKKISKEAVARLRDRYDL